MRLTTQLGAVEYDEDDVIHFPEGIPAFEEEHEFIRLNRPDVSPLVCLQSVRNTELVFVTVAVRMIEPNYALRLETEQLRLLGWSSEREPKLEEDILCLAILTLTDQPTANLLSPVVINRATRLACQVIQTDSAYSCRHALPRPAPLETPCS